MEKLLSAQIATQVDFCSMPAHAAHTIRALGPRTSSNCFPRAIWRVLGALSWVLMVGSFLSAAEPWTRVRLSVDQTPSPKSRATLAATWEATPVRGVVDRIAEHTGAAILVDRKIDPTTPITLASSGDGPTLLRAVAQQQGWGVSSLGNAWYLGPKQSARELRTLHARAKQFSSRANSAAAKQLARQTPLRLARLNQPRAALAELLHSRDLRLSNAQAIPFDLWPETDLPDLELSELLTLLLVGFDLDWQVEKNSPAIRLAPIKQPAAIVATHKLRSGSNITKQQFAELAPHARVTGTPDLWTVTGLVEDHELLDHRLRGRERSASTKRTSPKQRNAAWSDKRFTLTVQEKPTAAILKQVARSLAMELVDETAGDTHWFEQRISFQVEQVTLPDLLAEIARESKLNIQIDENRIVVRPEKP